MINKKFCVCCVKSPWPVLHQPLSGTDGGNRTKLAVFMENLLIPYILCV